MIEEVFLMVFHSLSLLRRSIRESSETAEALNTNRTSISQPWTWDILVLGRIFRWVNHNHGRYFRKWCEIWIFEFQSTFRDLLEDGKKIMGQAESRLLTFKISLFHADHCFQTRVSSARGRMQHDERFKKGAHIFFSVLLDHSDTIQPKNPMWHAWGENITTMKLAPDFSSERARKDWEVHCPHDTP